MKTRLRVGDKIRPMRLEAGNGPLVDIVIRQRLLPAQMRVLKNHLRLVAEAFTQLEAYSRKRQTSPHCTTR